MIQLSLKKFKSLAVHVRLYYRRWLYSRIENTGRHIHFHLPRELVVDLYPKGQIPELLYTSQFEWEEIGLVASILKSGMNVLDIGANVGLYSVVAGKIVEDIGRVWAFEPSTETCARLRDNLTLNQVVSVEVVQVALSDVIEDSLVLKRDPGYRDGDRYLTTRKNMNIQVACQSKDAGDVEIVPVTTLDYFFSRGIEPSTRIDFIKMDIEGGEFAVFRGARQLLLSNPKIVIMFECTQQGCYCAGHTMEDVFQYLRSLGFGLFCKNSESMFWISDPVALKQAGNLWACRDEALLPRL